MVRRIRSLKRRSAWITSIGALPITGALIFGILGGLGSFTFGYAEGFSYFSTRPEACTNCHVMQEYYDTWQHSSHHHVAGCVDCHLPHTFVRKYVAKADNGFFHSLAFTLENYHEPIQIKPRNRRIAQSNCIDCHAPVVNQMLPDDPHAPGAAGEMLLCIHCHADVGHGPN